MYWSISCPLLPNLWKWDILIFEIFWAKVVKLNEYSRCIACSALASASSTQQRRQKIFTIGSIGYGAAAACRQKNSHILKTPKAITPVVNNSDLQSWTNRVWGTLNNLYGYYLDCTNHMLEWELTVRTPLLLSFGFEWQDYGCLTRNLDTWMINLKHYAQCSFKQLR